MGIVRIELGHRNYTRVDAEMIKRGYAATIIGQINGVDRMQHLPRGEYFLDEPTNSEKMRDEAYAVVQALGELGAQIIATSGDSAWRGLIPADDPS